MTDTLEKRVSDLERQLAEALLRLEKVEDRLEEAVKTLSRGAGRY